MRKANAMIEAKAVSRERQIQILSSHTGFGEGMSHSRCSKPAPLCVPFMVSLHNPKYCVANCMKNCSTGKSLPDPHHCPGPQADRPAPGQAVLI